VASSSNVHQLLPRKHADKRAEIQTFWVYSRERPIDLGLNILREIDEREDWELAKEAARRAGWTGKCREPIRLGMWLRTWSLLWAVCRCLQRLGSKLPVVLLRLTRMVGRAFSQQLMAG
jgi:hypothetical protein